MGIGAGRRWDEGVELLKVSPQHENMTTLGAHVVAPVLQNLRRREEYARLDRTPSNKRQQVNTNGGARSAQDLGPFHGRANGSQSVTSFSLISFRQSNNVHVV